MLSSIILERVFILEINGKEIFLADPNPDFSEKQVLNFYSATYPILTASTVQGPVTKNDQNQYKFVANLGTKG